MDCSSSFFSITVAFARKLNTSLVVPLTIIYVVIIIGVSQESEKVVGEVGCRPFSN